MFLRGVAWGGVVRWWLLVMWGSVRCGGWNGGHEESDEAPRRFFFAWWSFSTLQKETFLSYLNDLIQCMLFSSPPPFGWWCFSLDRRKPDLSDLHTWVQVNGLIQFFPVERGTLLHRRRERSTTQMKAGSNVPPPKRREGRKQRHPQDRGREAPPLKRRRDKAAPPTQGRKNSTSPKGDGTTFGFALLSPSLLLCGGVFSSHSSGWRCLPSPLSLSFSLSLFLAWCCFFPSPPPSGWWWHSFPFPSLRGGVSQHPSLTWCNTCCLIRLCHWVGIDFQNLTWRRRSEAPPPKGGGEERSTSPKKARNHPKNVG